MITPAYVRTMAAYNAEMNRCVYAAARKLTDAQRREGRGAFWHSLHGTLCHLLWADRQWMSRFAGWPPNPIPLAQSDTLVANFDELEMARFAADAALSAWASEIEAAWLADDLVWFSGAAKREMRRNKALLVTHLFNHQTHHRGQAHAILSQFGEDTGPTDLFVLVGDP